MIEGEKKIMLLVALDMLGRFALVAAGVVFIGWLFWRFA